MAWRLIFGKTFGVEAKLLARLSAWKQPNGVGGQIHCQPLAWMILWGRPAGRPAETIQKILQQQQQQHQQPTDDDDDFLFLLKLLILQKYCKR